MHRKVRTSSAMRSMRRDMRPALRRSIALVRRFSVTDSTLVVEELMPGDERYDLRVRRYPLQCLYRK